MSALLDQPPRTLRQALDETQAEIAREFADIRALYGKIDAKAERIRVLEDRAATLGEEIIRRAKHG